MEQELLWRALQAVHPEQMVTVAARGKLRDLLDRSLSMVLQNRQKGEKVGINLLAHIAEMDSAVSFFIRGRRLGPEKNSLGP